MHRSSNHRTLKTPNGEHEAVLTLPEAEGPHPAVLFVHGGGCTDVDCSVGPNNFPWSKHLAEGLATKGIAFLRYFRAPSDSLEWDLEVAEAGWQELTSHPAIDENRCVLLGHSEGSWQATLLASKLQQDSKYPPPSLLMEIGVFGSDLLEAMKDAFSAVDAPLLAMTDSQADIRPEAVSDYAETWHLDLKELVDDDGFFSARKLKQHRQAVMDHIKPMLHSDKRFSSWLKVPTNSNAIKELENIPIALIVGARDQETPPQQARLVFAALEAENRRHQVQLHELVGHNHYLALLSDAPLDTSFGPISAQAMKLIADLVHQPPAIST